MCLSRVLYALKSRRLQNKVKHLFPRNFNEFKVQQNFAKKYHQPPQVLPKTLYRHSKRDVCWKKFESRRFSAGLECGHRFFFFEKKNLLQSSVENWWALMRILWISFLNSWCVSDADHFSFEKKKWKQRFFNGILCCLKENFTKLCFILVKRPP